MAAAQGNPTCGSDIAFYMEINAMIHIQINKPRLEIETSAVWSTQVREFLALRYHREVYDCGVAAYVQQVLLAWPGSPWLSFTAAGPTLGAWERTQLGFALRIRDRPGQGSRLNICY